MDTQPDYVPTVISGSSGHGSWTEVLVNEDGEASSEFKRLIDALFDYLDGIHDKSRFLDPARYDRYCTFVGGVELSAPPARMSELLLLAKIRYRVDYDNDGNSVPKLDKEGFRALCIWQMKTSPQSSIEVWNRTIRSFHLQNYSRPELLPFAELPAMGDWRIPERDDVAYMAFKDWLVQPAQRPAPSAFAYHPPSSPPPSPPLTTSRELFSAGPSSRSAYPVRNTFAQNITSPGPQDGYGSQAYARRIGGGSNPPVEESHPFSARDPNRHAPLPSSYQSTYGQRLPPVEESLSLPIREQTRHAPPPSTYQSIHGQRLPAPVTGNRRLLPSMPPPPSDDPQYQQQPNEAYYRDRDRSSRHPRNPSVVRGTQYEPPQYPPSEYRPSSSFPNAPNPEYRDTRRHPEQESYASHSHPYNVEPRAPSQYPQYPPPDGPPTALPSRTRLPEMTYADPYRQTGYSVPNDQGASFQHQQPQYRPPVGPPPSVRPGHVALAEEGNPPVEQRRGRLWGRSRQSAQGVPGPADGVGRNERGQYRGGEAAEGTDYDVDDIVQGMRKTQLGDKRYPNPRRG